MEKELYAKSRVNEASFSSFSIAFAKLLTPSFPRSFCLFVFCLKKIKVDSLTVLFAKLCREFIYARTANLQSCKIIYAK